MTKQKKTVFMECPHCHARYEKEPLIEIQVDGSTLLKEVFPRTCKSCGCNLIRRVEKT